MKVHDVENQERKKKLLRHLAKFLVILKKFPMILDFLIIILVNNYHSHLIVKISRTKKTFDL